MPLVLAKVKPGAVRAALLLAAPGPELALSAVAMISPAMAAMAASHPAACSRARRLACRWRLALSRALAWLAPDPPRSGPLDRPGPGRRGWEREVSPVGRPG
ncbi:MAG TPA: hypothetical protein VF070_44535 [Streptosporangiaceae bacterium]